MSGAGKAKLACKGIWKLFGKNAELFMAANPSPTPEALRGAELMAGVRDVSLEIGEGEIFIVMGLSGEGATLTRGVACRVKRGLEHPQGGVL